jgi:hypothetical protein
MPSVAYARRPRDLRSRRPDESARTHMGAAVACDVQSGGSLCAHLGVVRCRLGVCVHGVRTPVSQAVSASPQALGPQTLAAARGQQVWGRPKVDSRAWAPSKRRSEAKHSPWAPHRLRSKRSTAWGSRKGNETQPQAEIGGRPRSKDSGRSATQIGISQPTSQTARLPNGSGGVTPYVSAHRLRTNEYSRGRRPSLTVKYERPSAECSSASGMLCPGARGQ